MAPQSNSDFASLEFSITLHFRKFAAVFALFSVFMQISVYDIVSFSMCASAPVMLFISAFTVLRTSCKLSLLSKI